MRTRVKSGGALGIVRRAAQVLALYAGVDGSWICAAEPDARLEQYGPEHAAATARDAHILPAQPMAYAWTPTALRNVSWSIDEVASMTSESAMALRVQAAESKSFSVPALSVAGHGFSGHAALSDGATTYFVVVEQAPPAFAPPALAGPINLALDVESIGAATPPWPVEAARAFTLTFAVTPAARVNRIAPNGAMFIREEEIWANAARQPMAMTTDRFLNERLAMMDRWMLRRLTREASADAASAHTAAWGLHLGGARLAAAGDPAELDAWTDRACGYWRKAYPVGFGLVCLAVFTRAGEAAVDGGGDARRPNVLLIVVDTLRADHVSAYGHDRPTTPFLDKLAGEGARFANHFSGAPWTTPSLAALFTGRAAAEHGLDSVRRKLPDGLPTLAERLRAAGYHTLAALCNPCAAGRMGFARGFDRYDDFTAALDLEMNLFGGGTPRRVHEAITGPLSTKTFLKHLSRRPKDRPWFGFALHYDPHDLYMPSEKHRRPFSDSPPRPLAPDAARTPGSDALAESVARYDGEIRATDEEIEKLLARLRGAGHFTDDDLLITTSDHGEEFRGHGGLRHGGTYFDELVHVPLIVRWPGRIPAARIVTALTAHEDVSDAILRAVNAAAPETPTTTPHARANFWALATGAVDVGRAAVPMSGDDGRRLLGWRTRDWLVTLPRADAPQPDAATAWNLRDDPEQQHPLKASTHPESAALAAALSAGFRVADLERRRHVGDTPSSEDALTHKKIDLLKSLGYLH